MSTPYTFIDDDRESMTISSYCKKHEGDTTREELAKFTEGIMLKHGQSGHVTTVITDCEPSIVKAGYHPEAKNLATHIGCAGHRLLSSAGDVPSGDEVTNVLTNARKITARFGDRCHIARVKPKP